MDTEKTEITIDKVIDFIDLGVGSSTSSVVSRYIADKAPNGVSIKVGNNSKAHTLRHGRENVELGYLGFGSLREKPIPTYLSDMALINPYDLEKELNGLDSRRLVKNPWTLLWCDPRAIVVTPYDKAWSQIHELSKSEKSRGTLGTGAGKAYVRACDAPDRAIYAQELLSRDVVRQKLIDTREYAYTIIKDLSLPALPKNATENAKKRHEKDQALFDELHKWFEDEDNSMLEGVVEDYECIGARLQFLTLEQALKKFKGTAVIERSHGVLSDSQYGLKPYVSHLRTIPELFDDKLRAAGFTGPINRYGVHRAYEYRHDRGPMPTYRPKFRKELGLPAKRKESRLRGPVRTGILDLPMMAYAVNCCGGPSALNGLIITCFDQITPLHEWSICVKYLLDGDTLKYDAKLTNEILEKTELLDVQINIADTSVFNNKDCVFNFVSEIMSSYFVFGDTNARIDIPVVGVSYGTSESSMIWRLNRQQKRA